MLVKHPKMEPWRVVENGDGELVGGDHLELMDLWILYGTEVVPTKISTFDNKNHVNVSNPARRNPYPVHLNLDLI